MKPSWQFHKRDKDHPDWGWDQLPSDEFVTILTEHLCHFETMTWDEILKTSGGRTQGNNHHNIDVNQCIKEAQNRLIDLRLDDIDQLFSLRLTGKYRLWGVKEGSVLRFIWIDKEHTIYRCAR